MPGLIIFFLWMMLAWRESRQLLDVQRIGIHCQYQRSSEVLINLPFSLIGIHRLKHSTF